MPIQVGLMGFGHIGRSIFRILEKHGSIGISAICDRADPHHLAYLLKYDTRLGRLCDGVAFQDGCLHHRSQRIPMLTEDHTRQINWEELGVDMVIVATARPQSRQEAAVHLSRGAKRVILCVPCTDAPDATVLMGFNHQILTPQHRIISNGSVVAHCAAPLMKILDEAFGLDRIFYTTIAAYGSAQRLTDTPSDTLRNARSASENIIPGPASDDPTIARYVPNLQGKISSMACHVPILNGSLLDMVSFTRKPVTVASANEAVRAAFASTYPKIGTYATDPIASSDVGHSPYSCTLDSLATLCLGDRTLKTLAWYDNVWGYAHRTVELVEYLAGLQGGLA